MTYTVAGCDVSSWNGAVDFTRMRQAGAEFCFIKSSQATWTDKNFAVNWVNSRAQKMPRGAYHYLDWTRPAIDQARYFANLLTADPGELPPVVDFEEHAGAPANAAGQLQIFCDEFVRLTGRLPMIYTSPGYWAQHGSVSATWRQYKLWLAHYTSGTPLLPVPWQSWEFWQYSSQGSGPAYGAGPGTMDLNWYHGTIEQFRAEYNLAVTPPPLTDAQKIDRLWQAHPELH